MQIAKLFLVTLFSIAVAACGGGGANGGGASGGSASGGGASATISATATSTSQYLAVGTAMASFQPLTASGGATPYTYSITTGTLPAGLSLNASTGVVTGTPTAAYTTANLVISVRDANSVVASTASTVSFSVIDAAATTTAQNLNVTKAMTSFTPLTASGGTSPYTYSITTGTLPSGLSLDTSTGAVTGIPIATYATANIVFSVKDANNIVASKTSIVSFTVLPAGYVVQGGLIWMPAIFSDTWANANSYCANTFINSLTGWRLPTYSELQGLYGSRAMNGQGWTVSATWSSPSTLSIYYGYDFINLIDGTTGSGGASAYSFYVTCVH